jgi:hypothetical protein
MRKRLLALVLIVATASAVAAVFAQGRGGQRPRAFSDRRAPQNYDDVNIGYDGRLAFVRVRYATSFGGFGRRGGGREPAWAHDYPTADIHMMKIVNDLTTVGPHVDGSNIYSLDDPELMNHPIAYLSEPGAWSMSDEEAAGLRSYLLKGGFLIVDDFPRFNRDGSQAWPNFEFQMSRVFPNGRWVDLNDIPGHPIFHTFFEVDPNTVPLLYNLGGEAIFRALFEGNDPGGRMQVIANYQNDLSEYWESSNDPMVPIDESNEAYKFGVNEFIYGVTH